MWFRSSSDPKAEWKSIAARTTGHDYTADHRDGQFYIRTNKDKATNFKAMTWFDAPWGPNVGFALMVIAPAILLAIARWRKWF